MLLVLTAVTLLTLDFRSFGPLATVQRGLRNVLAPVRSGVETVTQPITDGARGIIDYGHLQDENARLRKENRELKKELARKEKALAEAADLLTLKKNYPTLFEDDGES